MKTPIQIATPIARETHGTKARLAATRKGALLALLTTLLLPTGCGYMVGGPYRRDVETVHVPIFTSTSFRRDVELQLTEAVHREIQKQTHYRLVKGPHADTRLTGRITRVRKRVLGESADDGARELQFEISLIVTWQDLRSNKVIVKPTTIQLDPDAQRLLAHSSFTPETGGSLATARKRAIDNLARQVVTLMQTPW